MTTARDIVTSALARLRTFGFGDDPPAEEAARALDRLNQMIAGMKSVGIDLQMSTLALSDTFRFFVPPSALSAETIEALASQGTWNASTNSPTLATGTGTDGYYYRVSTAGSTTLDDVTSWSVDDYAVFDGVQEVWLKAQRHEKHHQGIIALLAMEISDDFSKTPSPSLVMAAKRGWQGLQGDYFRPPTDSFDVGVIATTSRRAYGGWLN